MPAKGKYASESIDMTNKMSELPPLCSDPKLFGHLPESRTQVGGKLKTNVHYLLVVGRPYIHIRYGPILLEVDYLASLEQKKTCTFGLTLRLRLRLRA